MKGKRCARRGEKELRRDGIGREKWRRIKEKGKGRRVKYKDARHRIGEVIKE